MTSKRCCMETSHGRCGKVAVYTILRLMIVTTTYTIIDVKNMHLEIG